MTGEQFDVLAKLLRSRDPAKMAAKLVLVDGLTRKAAQVDFGEIATGYPSVMGKSARLNPALSRWLQGLRPSWDACAPTGTL